MLTKEQRAVVRLRLEEGWPIEKVAAFYRIGIAEVENVGQDLLNDIVYQCPEWDGLREYLKRRLEGKTPLVDIIPRLPTPQKAERGHRPQVKLDDPETLAWLEREGLVEDFVVIKNTLQQSLEILLRERGLRNVEMANIDLIDRIADREALLALRRGKRAKDAQTLSSRYLVTAFLREIKRRKDANRRRAEASVLSLDELRGWKDDDPDHTEELDLKVSGSPTMGEWRWRMVPDPSQKLYIKPHYNKRQPPRPARKARPGEWASALSPHDLLVRIWGQSTLDMIADDPLKEKYAHLQCPPVPMATKIANILEANPGVHLSDLSPKELDALERIVVASEQGREEEELEALAREETNGETVTV